MTDPHNGESFTILFTMTPKILSLIIILKKCANNLPNRSKIRLATPGKFYQDFLRDK